MMSLTTAIRRGAQIRGQAFSYLFTGGGSCVVGAAVEGAGLMAYRAGAFLEHLPELPADWHMTMTTACPVCGRRLSRLVVIMHLNDGHTWCREAIAAWLDTLEQAERPVCVDADLVGA